MQSDFDSLAQTLPDDDSIEFWFARDLQKPLGYARWENFMTAIQRAIDSCETTGYKSEHHFRGVTKLITHGKGGQREIDDFMLTCKRATKHLLTAGYQLVTSTHAPVLPPRIQSNLYPETGASRSSEFSKKAQPRISTGRCELRWIGVRSGFRIRPADLLPAPCGSPPSGERTFQE